jgi:tetratricopeptide (TPR) repeat protein
MRGFAVAALLLALAGSAAAKPAPKPPSKDDAAREHFKKGITAYNLGDYELAVNELRKSYELSEAAPLLFNIAQAYRAKGEYQKALLFYRNFLRLVPNAPNFSDAEALAAEMQQRITAAEQTASEEARRRANEDFARRAADEEARRQIWEEEARRRAAVVPPQAIIATPTPKALPPKPVYKRWYFWTGIVGGVVVVGATAGALAATVGVKTVLPSGSLGTIDGR